jgi:hypothetical protein
MPRAAQPRIIDAFPLFTELDLLEVRLRELEHVVDTFVIVEADRTFAGRPKPFFFERSRRRFQQWSRKIVYRKLHLPEMSYIGSESERFRVERRQRDEIGRVVAELGLRRDDIVVISDVDEIWRARCADDLVHAAQNHDYCVMVLLNYRGYVNNISTRALNGALWSGPVACRPSVLTRLGADAVRRSASAGRVYDQPIRKAAYLQDAGWHFSSLGGPEAFWVKAQNFSHTFDPHRVIDVPEHEQVIRPYTGPLTRDRCIVSQRTYLSHADEVTFAPLTYDEFAIEQDVPAAIRIYKDKFRRFFFFTDCV